ncbi:MAG TPA: hypothetical protein VGW78_01975 [Candidatus Babeliales bacterium]|jgi:hypothetical protein|nr:hypothetical protein [Candidatus Babeliales bacterium]
MIDATIIIQIINFCLIWLALYTIVLRPVFAIIARRNAYDQSLKQQEADLQAGITLLQDKNYTLWHMAHLRYKQTQIYAIAPLTPRIEYVRSFKEFQEDDTTSLITDIQQLIIKKVKESV